MSGDAAHTAEIDAGWNPGRWWRVLASDGSLWCETSDEDEARAAFRAGDTLQRLYVRTEEEWRPDSDPPATRDEDPMWGRDPRVIPSEVTP